MLEVAVPQIELFNNDTNEFTQLPAVTLRFEHSLKAIGEWEAIWKVPFLSENEKTKEMSDSYLMCMCLTPGVDRDVFRYLPDDCLEQIAAYMQDEKTATVFSSVGGNAGKKKMITSEEIYYWMIEAGIPFSCETWHISRLLTLIRICGINMSDRKKMSRKEVAAQNRALNEARRAKYHTRG